MTSCNGGNNTIAPCLIQITLQTRKNSKLCHTCPRWKAWMTPPTFSETLEAINSLRNKKSPGTDGLPGEVLKSGGAALHHELHQLNLSIWVAEEVPPQWKNVRIISIYKRKGDRPTCGNSRWISLLSVAGKVLAKLLLGRLNKNIVGRVCPESQCGFRV